MTLILIIGLSLVAASVVLVLRSFSLASAERQADARPDRGLRLPLVGVPVEDGPRRRVQRARGARDGDW